MVVTTLMFVAACVPVDPDTARAAWLREELVRDNTVWIDRPELLATKYIRMSADRFDFLRGTSGVFAADLARADPDRTTTMFLTVPEAARVLLAGDPHPENFGTTLAVGEPLAGQGSATAVLSTEPVDLDGAAFGPWLVDVRRAALGLAVLVEPLPGCEADCIANVASTFARGYGAEIIALEAGEPGCDPTSESLGGQIWAGVRSKAREKGMERSKIETYTEFVDGERRIIDTAVDTEGIGLLPLSDEQSMQLARLIAGWSARPDGFRVLDSARRYGSGIASLPAVRYGVLWDLGAADDSDDYLLNVREVVNPPLPPGRFETVPVLFDDNADRIEQASNWLWSTPQADPLMGAVQAGIVAFKFSSWSGWYRELDHLDLQEDWAEGLVEADLLDLADALGHLLAGVHARGVTGAGGPSITAIAADLGGDVDGLASEIVANAAEDLAQLDADLARFNALLDEFGPLLGAEVYADDVPR